MAKKKKNDLIPTKTALIDEASLFKQVSAIIEKRKNNAGKFANREVILILKSRSFYDNIGGFMENVL
jgi:hypothetical protein